MQSAQVAVGRNETGGVAQVCDRGVWEIGEVCEKRRQRQNVAGLDEICQVGQPLDDHLADLRTAAVGSLREHLGLSLSLDHPCGLPGRGPLNVTRRGDESLKFHHGIFRRRRCRCHRSHSHFASFRVSADSLLADNAAERLVAFGYVFNGPARAASPVANEGRADEALPIAVHEIPSSDLLQHPSERIVGIRRIPNFPCSWAHAADSSSLLTTIKSFSDIPRASASF